MVLMLVALSLRSATTACTATLMPRRRSMGFMPAATDLVPSDRMARVSTVAVVVPDVNGQLTALLYSDNPIFHVSFQIHLVQSIGDSVCVAVVGDAQIRGSP